MQPQKIIINTLLIVGVIAVFLFFVPLLITVVKFIAGVVVAAVIVGAIIYRCLRRENPDRRVRRGGLPLWSGMNRRQSL